MRSKEPKRVRRTVLTTMTPRPTGKPIVTKKLYAGSALNAVIGKEVRHLRRSLDLSATQLAAKAGLSNGMLSKIEAGIATPSLQTLAGLSSALNVPITRLFAGYGSRKDLSYVPAGKGLVVNRHGARKGEKYELIGHLLSGELFIEPYLVTLDENASTPASFQHTGVELIHFLTGAVEYRYDNKTVTANPGDTLLFDSTAVHGPMRILKGPVRLLSIVINIRL